MNKPKITLIVPIYNTYNFLYRCLTSIKNQTFKDFEVILVNDGSTDDSEAFCEEYIKSDIRFILKTKVNGGLSSARNYGLNYAKGEYIGFIDSDDYIDENYCKKLYEITSKQKMDVLNFGLTYVKDETHEKRNSNLVKNRLISKSELFYVLKFSSTNKILWFAWSNLYRREFLKENNISFDENILLGEDTLFDLECFYKAEMIYSISEALYYYVYNAQSLTQIKYKTNLLDKFETQFNARLKFHKNNEPLNSNDYYQDIAINYIEHSLLILLNNLKNSTNLNNFEEIKKIRKSIIYQFCFQHYILSKYATSKMIIIVYLFKFKFYKLLAFIYNLK